MNPLIYWLLDDCIEYSACDLQSCDMVISVPSAQECFCEVKILIIEVNSLNIWRISKLAYNEYYLCNGVLLRRLHFSDGQWQ